MSQEKVNRYKEQKANRKETAAKAKRQKLIGTVIGAVIALALVVWLGYSVYDSFIAEDPAPIEMDASAMEDYLETLEDEEE